MPSLHVTLTELTVDKFQDFMIKDFAFVLLRYRGFCSLSLSLFFFLFSFLSPLGDWGEKRKEGRVCVD